VLNELKREGVFCEYAIGGAMAALFYCEPMFTQDLDVFILFSEPTEGKIISLEPIYDTLRKRGYRNKREYIEIEGIPVQFLPAAGALLEEALREANIKRYEGMLTRVMRPEHLIAIALQTGRAKDRTRVSLLMEQSKLDIGYLYSILKRYGLKEKFNEWMV